MERPPLSIVFAFIDSVCVQSVIQLMNTPFMMSFSKVIIVQVFETVAFCVICVDLLLLSVE